MIAKSVVIVAVVAVRAKGIRNLVRNAMVMERLKFSVHALDVAAKELLRLAARLRVRFVMVNAI